MCNKKAPEMLPRPRRWCWKHLIKLNKDLIKWLREAWIIVCFSRYSPLGERWYSAFCKSLPLPPMPLSISWNGKPEKDEHISFTHCTSVEKGTFNKIQTRSSLFYSLKKIINLHLSLQVLRRFILLCMTRLPSWRDWQSRGWNCGTSEASGVLWVAPYELTHLQQKLFH